MRGNVPNPIHSTTMLGDLARRVEVAGQDCGLLAHPMESERSGNPRILRFCLEAFLKLASGMDASLQEALGYADDLIHQILTRCPEDKQGAVQTVLNSTAPLAEDNLVQKLWLAERRLRQLVDLI